MAARVVGRFIGHISGTLPVNVLLPAAVSFSHRYLQTTTTLDRVDACLVNGGMIRSSIEANYVTLKTIFNVLPFGNTMVLIKVTGAQVIFMLACLGALNQTGHLRSVLQIHSRKCI